MIDSHCHLDHEPLLNDLDNVLKRSKDIGIEKLLTISTSFESFNRIKKIVEKDEIFMGQLVYTHMKQIMTQLILNLLQKTLKKIKK